MRPRRSNILILNASLAGDSGNTAVLIARAKKLLSRQAVVEVITLATDSGNQTRSFASLKATLAKTDGFLFGTGTHWDSWSSVFQKFLEEATATEATKLWLGKPAAVLVSEHSVGGKGVVSRLQGVLNTFGCTIPPMSGLVLSRAALIAALHDDTAARDLWCSDDLKVVCHNLVEAARGGTRWRAWPVDRKDFKTRWVS